MIGIRYDDCPSTPIRGSNPLMVVKATGEYRTTVGSKVDFHRTEDGPSKPFCTVRLNVPCSATTETCGCTGTGIPRIFHAMFKGIDDSVTGDWSATLNVPEGTYPSNSCAVKVIGVPPDLVFFMVVLGLLSAAVIALIHLFFTNKTVLMKEQGRTRQRDLTALVLGCLTLVCVMAVSVYLVQIGPNSMPVAVLDIAVSMVVLGTILFVVAVFFAMLWIICRFDINSGRDLLGFWPTEAHHHPACPLYEPKKKKGEQAGATT